MSDPSVARHAFTDRIEAILTRHFGAMAADIFRASPLLGYLNQKTRSANRGSKARGAFANHYALYVVVEDYLKKGFAPGGVRDGGYSNYEGARFSDLFRRQRELPFGQKLQNHALNTRLNDEFRKFYPALEKEPIVRDVSRQRYWVHQDLLTVELRDKQGRERVYNLAPAIIDIVDEYVATKMEAFESFIDACRKISELTNENVGDAIAFIGDQLQPNVDARIFEIVSFSVLKAYYGEQTLFWGWSRESFTEEALTLYKTGRTNANDGGIDFVMKPLGRFFQVTETIDVGKYFLDIDKIQRFPLTFVVKSMDSEETIKKNIRTQALQKYRINAVVQSYMDALEEIINIPVLLERLGDVVSKGNVVGVMDEIIRQSRVEFNYAALDEVEIDESDEALEV
jgi:hypothetical protein